MKRLLLAVRWAVICLPLNHQMKYHLASGPGTARNLSNHFHRCTAVVRDCSLVQGPEWCRIDEYLLVVLASGWDKLFSQLIPNSFL